MKRVYLSGMFSQKEKIKKYSEELAELGVEPTSTWVGEQVAGTVAIKDVPDHYLTETAIIDINDMLKADTFVVFVPTDEELEVTPRRSLSRGGRNFESGFFYAMMVFATYLPLHIRTKKEFIVVGQRESVFHFLYNLQAQNQFTQFPLPEIKQVSSWDEVKSYLTGAPNVRSEEVVEASEATEQAK